MKNKLILIAVFSLLLINVSNGQDIMLLKTSGKVVIGDTAQISTPGPYNLYVQNGILTEKVKVAVKNTGEWSDDEWENTPSIADVKSAIKNNKHLPGIPSAETLVEAGYELKSMDAKLLAQIEWLWQHMIKLDAENKILRQKIETLENAE